MNAFELRYYEAGIKDAHEKKSIVLACRSKRFEDLCREDHTKIGDKRGDSVHAYNNGVSFEITRQTLLDF